jgi:DNA repair exonuclease SbcCD ATPase subunit
MKKQGRQLNILNGLFLKSVKEQEQKLSSGDIPKSKADLGDSGGKSIGQKEVSNMIGRSTYSSGLKTHKQLLERYLQHSEKYFDDLAEYKKGYFVLNRTLEDFNQLSQKIAGKKEEYTSEMVKYEEVKQKYEQSLKEYQEITEEYENIIRDRETAQRKFEEHSLALKNINAEVQDLIDKKSEKNDNFVELKGKLVIEREVFKATQSRLNGIISVYELLKKSYQEKKETFEESRKKYHHANTIKNDWEMLIKDFEKTKSNKQKFEQNLQSIDEKIKNTEEEANTSKEIYSFVEPSLAAMEEKYKEHKKIYEAAAIAYNISEKSYDTEYGKYAELKENLEEMNSLKNPSKTVIGYITRDMDVAKSRVDNLAKDFYPLEEKFKLQKSVFEQISASYQLVKNLVDEKKDKSKVYNDSLSQTLAAQKKITMVLEVLKSKYGLLNHQRGQSQEAFKVISQEYDKLEREFQKEQSSFKSIKDDYVAFENRYNSTKQSYDAAKEKLAQSEENLEIVKKAYSDVAGLLRIATANKESILEKYKESEKELKNLTETKDGLKFEVENNFLALEETYQNGEQLYLRLKEQAKNWHDEYPQYSSSYKTILPEYTKMSNQLEKLNQQYEVIYNDYQTLDKSRESAQTQYQEEMQKYNSNQELYNRVSQEFNHCLDLRNNVLKKDNGFESALHNLNQFIFKNDTFTFPINEATGSNFIDEFNIPEIEVSESSIRLTRKFELSQWTETFQNLYVLVESLAKELIQALNEYQKQVSNFMKVGGKKLTDIGNSEIAYRGTNIESYLNRLSNNFKEWQTEYENRERAFALLVKNYRQYLDESIKLNENIAKMSDSKNGLQEIVNAINSLPNYMDIYSPSYRNVELLANSLGTEVSDLTHLQNADELQETIHKVYLEHVQALVDENLENTITHFTEIRSSYDQSISNLRKQLDAMGKMTGIPTRRIVIESSLPNDLDLKTYFKSALDENVKELLSTITGSSSFINSVKKVKQFKRVQNLLSVNEGGSAIILPEVPINFNKKELEFSLVIATVKNIEAPNKVEKLGSSYPKPEQPDILTDKPSYIEDILEVEKIEKKHQKIEKKEALKALA